MDNETEARLDDLVAAFSELGPTWVRWVDSRLPSDSGSFARMRLLTALQCHNEQTMSGLASALGVTPRRVTALVDALEAEGMVERRPHATDARCTVVSLTPTGRQRQEQGWRRFQTEVGLAFLDLPVDEQKHLLAIARTLTESLRARIASRPSTNQTCC